MLAHVQSGQDTIITIQKLDHVMNSFMVVVVEPQIDLHHLKIVKKLAKGITLVQLDITYVQCQQKLVLAGGQMDIINGIIIIVRKKLVCHLFIVDVMAIKIIFKTIGRVYLIVVSRLINLNLFGACAKQSNGYNMHFKSL